MEIYPSDRKKEANYDIWLAQIYSTLGCARLIVDRDSFISNKPITTTTSSVKLVRHETKIKTTCTNNATGTYSVSRALRQWVGVLYQHKVCFRTDHQRRAFQFHRG